jgi:hypothetical protein
MTVSQAGNPPPNVFQVHWVRSQQSANNVAAPALGGFGFTPASFFNDSTKTVNITIDSYGYFASF